MHTVLTFLLAIGTAAVLSGGIYLKKVLKDQSEPWDWKKFTRTIFMGAVAGIVLVARHVSINETTIAPLIIVLGAYTFAFDWAITITWRLIKKIFKH